MSSITSGIAHKFITWVFFLQTSTHRRSVGKNFLSLVTTELGKRYTNNGDGLKAKGHLVGWRKFSLLPCGGQCVCLATALRVCGRTACTRMDRDLNTNGNRRTLRPSTRPRPDGPTTRARCRFGHHTALLVRVVLTTMPVVRRPDPGPLAAADPFQMTCRLVRVAVRAAHGPHGRLAHGRLMAPALGRAQTDDRAVRPFPARRVVQTRVDA